MPEHRRVLGGARGHLPDPRREVHAALRLLRRDDRPSPIRSTRTSPRGSRRRSRAMGLRYVVLTGVARDDLPDGGARIWADGDPRVPRGRARHRRGGAAERLQGRRARHRHRARRRSRRVRPQPRDRPAAARPDPAGVRLRPLARGAALREAPPPRPGDEVEPDPRDGRARPRRSPGAARPRATPGVDIVTMGQYLQPTPHHLPVRPVGARPRSSPSTRRRARRSASRTSRPGRSCAPATTPGSSCGARVAAGDRRLRNGGAGL